MTERDFEQYLRAGFREIVDDAAPSALRARVLAVPAVESTIPPRGLGRWGFPRTNRFAPLALAATAVVIALLIGIGLFVRSPDVGPSPIPGPTHSATPQPDGTPEPIAQRPATWTTTGSMADARFDFTATLLLDGRVLVAGGDLGYNANPRALASAELYDPASGTWTTTGSMLTGRYRHTATLLPDGKVLVAGGNVNNSNVIGIRCCLASAELYDPSTGTWTPTGSMNAPRVDHWATLLPDGTVLVAGGDAYPNTGLERFPVERYDPGSGTWSATEESEISVGHDQTATLLPDGRVLFLGTTLYDPTTGSWSNTLGCCFGGDLDTYGGNGTATRLSDGQVLRAGGRGHVPSAEPGFSYRSIALGTAAVYDPVGGGWRATGSMHVGRVDAAAALLAGGRVIVIGGDKDGVRHAIASTELYDPATETWATTASMAEARFSEIAILLLDGRVLVVGGAGSEVLVNSETLEYAAPALASAELYDPGDGP